MTEPTDRGDADPYAAPPPGNPYAPPPPGAPPPPPQQWGTPPPQAGGPPQGWAPDAAPAYGYGYPPAAAPPANGLGTAGFVLAIVGLVLCWIPGLGAVIAAVGVVLSAVGLSRARKGRATNRGLALAGVLVASLALVIGVVVTAYVVDKVAECDSESLTQAELDACLEDEFGG